MEIERKGDVEEVVTVTRGSSGDKDNATPTLVWKEREPCASATAQAMFQEALRKGKLPCCAR